MEHENPSENHILVNKSERTKVGCFYQVYLALRSLSELQYKGTLGKNRIDFINLYIFWVYLVIGVLKLESSV